MRRAMPPYVDLDVSIVYSEDICQATWHVTQDNESCQQKPGYRRVCQVAAP